MNGLITVFIRFGIVVRINPSTQFGAPMALNFKGITLGTTVSMSVKQKSPHSKNRKSVISPAFVQLSVPTRKRSSSLPGDNPRD